MNEENARNNNKNNNNDAAKTSLLQPRQYSPTGGGGGGGGGTRRRSSSMFSTATSFYSTYSTEEQNLSNFDTSRHDDDDDESSSSSDDKEGSMEYILTTALANASPLTKSMFEKKHVKEEGVEEVPSKQDEEEEEGFEVSFNKDNILAMKHDTSATIPLSSLHRFISPSSSSPPPPTTTTNTFKNKHHYFNIHIIQALNLSNIDEFDLLHPYCTLSLYTLPFSSLQKRNKSSSSSTTKKKRILSLFQKSTQRKSSKKKKKQQQLLQERNEIMTRRTHVIWNNTNPIWNCQYDCIVPSTDMKDNNEETMLEICIKNYNSDCYVMYQTNQHHHHHHHDGDDEETVKVKEEENVDDNDDDVGIVSIPLHYYFSLYDNKNEEEDDNDRKKEKEKNENEVELCLPIQTNDKSSSSSSGRSDLPPSKLLVKIQHEYVQQQQQQQHQSSQYDNVVTTPTTASMEQHLLSSEEAILSSIMEQASPPPHTVASPEEQTIEHSTTIQANDIQKEDENNDFIRKSRDGDDIFSAVTDENEKEKEVAYNVDYDVNEKTSKQSSHQSSFKQPTTSVSTAATLSLKNQQQEKLDVNDVPTQQAVEGIMQEEEDDDENDVKYVSRNKEEGEGIERSLGEEPKSLLSQVKEVNEKQITLQEKKTRGAVVASLSVQKLNFATTTPATGQNLDKNNNAAAVEEEGEEETEAESVHAANINSSNYPDASGAIIVSNQHRNVDTRVIMEEDNENIEREVEQDVNDDDDDDDEPITSNLLSFIPDKNAQRQFDHDLVFEPNCQSEQEQDKNHDTNSNQDMVSEEHHQQQQQRGYDTKDDEQIISTVSTTEKRRFNEDRSLFINVHNFNEECMNSSSADRNISDTDNDDDNDVERGECHDCCLFAVNHQSGKEYSIEQAYNNADNYNEEGNCRVTSNFIDDQYFSSKYDYENNDDKNIECYPFHQCLPLRKRRTKNMKEARKQYNDKIVVGKIENKEVEESLMHFKAGVIERVFSSGLIIPIMSTILLVPAVLLLLGGPDRFCPLIGRRRYSVFTALMPLSATLAGNKVLISFIDAVDKEVEIDSIAPYFLAERLTTLTIAVVAGLMMLVFGFLSSGFDIIFGLVVGVSQAATIVIASFVGMLAPVLFNIILGEDFTEDCGESIISTIQDSIGLPLMVEFSYWLFSIHPLLVMPDDMCI